MRAKMKWLLKNWDTWAILPAAILMIFIMAIMLFDLK